MAVLVLDCETKKEFSEVGRNFPERLGVSLVGIFDYSDNLLFAFREEALGNLRAKLAGASLVVGYNIKGFDWPVFQPYFPEMKLAKLPTLDLMEDIANNLGFRVGLSNAASATLGIGKTGHGLDAIRYFREGRWDELEKYCLHDVAITKDLYEFGAEHGFVKAETRDRGIVEVPVSWKRVLEPAMVNGTLF